MDNINQFLISNKTDLESLRIHLLKKQQHKSAATNPDFKYVTFQATAEFLVFIGENGLQYSYLSFRTLAQKFITRDLLFDHFVDTQKSKIVITMYDLHSGEKLGEEITSLGVNAKLGDFVCYAVSMKIPTYFKSYDEKKEVEGEKDILFFTLPMTKESWS